MNRRRTVIGVPALVALVALALFAAPRPTVASDILWYLAGWMVIILGATFLVRGSTRRNWRHQGLIVIASLLVADLLWSQPRLLEIVVASVVTVLISAVVMYQGHRPVLEYLYLARFPLLMATLLMALGPLCLWGAPGFLRNLLEVHAPGVVLVALLAGLVAHAIASTLDLIVRHGSRRAGVQQWPQLSEVTRILVATPASSLMTMPLLAFVVGRSDDPWWKVIPAALFGLALTEAVGWIARLFGESQPQAAPSAASQRSFRSRASAALCRAPQQLATQMRQHTGTLMAPHPEWLTAGFVDSDRKKLLGGYLTVSTLAIVTACVYVMGYWIFGPWENRWSIPDPPALAFLLILLLLLTWILGFVGFFLDRFRIPSALTIATLPFLLYFIHDLDHYYELVPASNASELHQATVQTAEQKERGEIRGALRARVAHWRSLYPDKAPVIVVVSSSGGGIAAALWTATVLTGLQEDFGEPFAHAIHLISAVSGGSAGSMYFVDGYVRDTKAPPASAGSVHVRVPDRTMVLQRAGASSLSAVAWGFAYPDFWRAFSLRHPRRWEIDRGWALERAWARSFKGEEPTLRQWREDTKAGWRPAVAFNATIAETGERLIMGSLGLNTIPESCGEPASREQALAIACEDGLRAKTDIGLYPQYDLSVVRAARLSSAFPFVSPISKARLAPSDNTAYHIADGGYYDNFGIVTSVEWMRKVIRLPRIALGVGNAPTLLLIQIRQSDYHATSKKPPRRRAGWFYALTGPVDTIMATRMSSQAARNDLEVELLTDWASKENWSLKTAVFLLPYDSPMSWHLSRAECNEFLQKWDDGRRNPDSAIAKALAVVRTLFAPTGVTNRPLAELQNAVCAG